MPILPLGRNTNYSPGVTPVRGNDLNDIQDCIVSGKHGVITYSKSFNGNPLSNAFVLAGQSLAVGQHFVIPMDGLCVGDAIVAADALVERQANPVYRLGLWEAIRFPTSSSLNSNPANSANSNQATVHQRLVIAPAAINGGAGLPVSANASYFLLVEFISGASYTFIVNSARWSVVRL